MLDQSGRSDYYHCHKLSCLTFCPLRRKLPGVHIFYLRGILCRLLITLFQLISFLSMTRDGPPPDFSGIPDFFFTSVGKKNLSPASWLFFLSIIRHYCRPSTKYKISRSIRISRFHVRKSQVFVLFRNWKKKKASHFVACLQAHKAWAKNKFYDRLNWRPWLNPLHTATQRLR